MDQSRTCPRCGTPVKAPRWFCAHCETDLEAQARIVWEHVQEEDRRQRQAPLLGLPSLLVLICSALCLVAAFGVGWLQERDRAGAPTHDPSAMALMAVTAETPLSNRSAPPATPTARPTATPPATPPPEEVVKALVTDDPNPAQAWLGQRALAANAEMVAGQSVYLERDVTETDEAGRLLRYIFLADGTFVNAKLVRLGLATVHVVPPDVKYEELLEEAARASTRDKERLRLMTATPQPQPTVAPTWTPTWTPTSTPSPTTLPSPEPTQTPAPPGMTKTPEPPAPTSTPQPPAPTSTPQPPARTNTPQPPTPTATPHPSETPEPTAVGTRSISP
jgi:hypothetical protein